MAKYIFNGKTALSNLPNDLNKSKALIESVKRASRVVLSGNSIYKFQGPTPIKTENGKPVKPADAPVAPVKEPVSPSVHKVYVAPKKATGPLSYKEESFTPEQLDQINADMIKDLSLDTPVEAPKVEIVEPVVEAPVVEAPASIEEPVKVEEPVAPEVILPKVEVAPMELPKFSVEELQAEDPAAPTEDPVMATAKRGRKKKKV